jgi:hypothetical protein
VKLKPRRKAEAKALRRGLGDRAVAKLDVKLTDGSGNAVSERLKVRLKR